MGNCVRGEPEVQRVSVVGFGLEGRHRFIVDNDQVLGDHRKYRSIVATINYMATDMPDLQFVCKEACREVSAPTMQSWKKVERIGGYLSGAV